MLLNRVVESGNAQNLSRNELNRGNNRQPTETYALARFKHSSGHRARIRYRQDGRTVHQHKVELLAYDSNQFFKRGATVDPQLRRRGLNNAIAHDSTLTRG